MMSKILLLVIFTSLTPLLLGFSGDEIQSLPGLTQDLPFRQYSGYLNSGQDIHFHYWFVESSKNSSIDPIIVWISYPMSAMYGLLTENGPFRVGRDGHTLTPNNYSWNTLANVLYLESWSDVGFSHGIKLENIDRTTAVQFIKQAIFDFFRKFPQFSNNDLYVIGQGATAPFVVNLALELLKNNSSISLRGVAIGDGDFLNIAARSSTQLHLALAYGLISVSTYEEYLRLSCQCTSAGYYCPVGVFDKVKKNASITTVEELDKFHGILNQINAYNVLSGCPLPWLNNGQLSVQKPNCPPDTTLLYMNRPEVRTALHMNTTARTWKSTTGHMNFGSALDTGSQLKELMNTYNMTNIFLYNGILDLTYNFLGNQQFVDSLGFKVTDSYEPLIVNRRIRGFVKRYEGITFITVRGAGIAVASDQPQTALAIVEIMLDGLNWSSIDTRSIPKKMIRN